MANYENDRYDERDKSGQSGDAPRTPREPYKFIPVDTPDDVLAEIEAARAGEKQKAAAEAGASGTGNYKNGNAAAGAAGNVFNRGKHDCAASTPPETTPRFENMADIMKEFHRGTWWETNKGEMAELAIEDTHAKITNYYVLHDRAWTHGAVVDFIDMDEGSGTYTVYALCTDGTVLAVPEEELDNPVTVTYEEQKVQMVRHLPREIEDTAELGRRILAEKDRTMDEYEKQKGQNS